jgi:hypothetical protein
MKTLITIIIASVILIQFNTEAKATDSRKQNLDNRITTDYSFLKKYRTEKVPMLDSTNFDNHTNTNLLTEKQIDLMSLSTVFKIDQNTEKELKIGINYLLDLSPEFKTVVFFFYPNEHELYSVLVNYDSEYKVIDFKTIAMDEIAESLIKTVSRIEKNRITITNYKFFNETIEETEIVDINENGKIKTRR